jgi:choline dehydrogenase-like flavoprotein
MTGPLSAHAAKLAGALDAFLALDDPAAARAIVDRMLEDLPRWHPDASAQITAAITTLERGGRWRRGTSLGDLATAALTSTHGEPLAAAELLRSVLVGAWASQPSTERVLGFDHRCLDPSPHAAAAEGPESLVMDRAHRDRADVVIVGSGAAGGVLAAALTAVGLSVTILEAGPAATLTDTAGSPLERLRRISDPMRMTAGTPVSLLAGRGAGGSTRAWYGTIERPSTGSIERWSALWGDVDRDWFHRRSDLLESKLGVASIPDALFGQNANAIGSGAVANARTVRALRRAAPGCHGCGTCLAGCPIGALGGTATPFLADAARGGATLIADARAETILVEDGRFHGIVARTSGGDEIRIDAALCVLAAGTIVTPALLQRNAIGSRSGTLGRGVALQPTMWLAGTFDGSLRSWRGVPQTLAISGPDHVRLRATAHPPSIAATLLPGTGIGARRAILEAEQLAGISVTVRDADARIDGERITWTPSAGTVRALAEGIEAAAAVLFEAGAIHVHTGIETLAPARSIEQVRDGLGALGARTPMRLVAHDLVGGCSVGDDPAEHVLAPNGAVHGIGGLFVADASALPDAPDVAPALSVMLNATRVAEHLASRAV